MPNERHLLIIPTLVHSMSFMPLDHGTITLETVSNWESVKKILMILNWILLLIDEFMLIRTYVGRCLCYSCVISFYPKLGDKLILIVTVHHNEVICIILPILCVNQNPFSFWENCGDIEISMNKYVYSLF